ERVSYRMMKLTKVDGARATIAVNTKHYVVSGSLGFPGLPPPKIGEFNHSGNGVIVVPAAEPASAQGENTESLLANLVPEGQTAPQGMQPGQQIPIRFEIRTKMTSTGN